MSKAKSKPKSKKNTSDKTGNKIYKGIIIVLVAILVIVTIILKMSIFKSYPVEGAKQKLSITNGETYTGFIDDLAKENKVSFPIVLKLYRKLFIHDTMKAGVYEVKQGMSVRQVLEMISNVENAQMSRLLVIEGTTTKQLITSLKNDPLIEKSVVHLPPAEMLKALNIPYDHPEGLFAPDTYFFDKGESDKKILTDLYQRQMKILDEAWEKRAPNLPYKDKYEALIMASIIEKETSVDRELRQVSGVFYRRLKLGMRLQTDPTVIYGMGDKYQGKISKQDLRTPTAYNTYTINGLPPTPIALPSKKAIEATMHPDDSDNIYFVATGNGGHKFSANLDDHNRAVREYIEVMRAKN
ncbi:endolytic transglycosylase MltG [Acinetobacter sp. WCHAc060033]|uniref:endolytic transglycosylase MltG n=1 Tax=Acinetobacter TaxID=469 RepID=UPI001023576C|nr:MULTISPECIES: endolytic transglycosylase MltG [Acinetobacter]RZG72247.1 endolytic transglycosylase MltG [Acinetobacter wuhouensis]RZG78330.1 endolytic transglycosylase MltG [Acinetobacter sp. WCHAc060033]